MNMIDKKIETDRFIRQLQERINNALSLLKENKIDDCRDELRAITSIATVRDLGVVFNPDINELALNSNDDLKTGFKELDRYMSVKTGAITVVGGRTGHGKTTMLLNMCLRMVKMYPERTFYFFSFEEDALAIYIKMCMNFICEDIHRDKKIKPIDYIFEYAKYTQGKIAKMIKSGKKDIRLEKALDILKGYLDTNRLKIIYKALTAEQLADVIYSEHDKHDIGAVFIDNVQKIGGYEKECKSETGRLFCVINTIRTMANETGVGVIMSARVPSHDDAIHHNDLPEADHLIECGDMPTQADTIITICRDLVNADQNIKVGVQKNKNGLTGAVVNMRFIGAMYRIEDY